MNQNWRMKSAVFRILDMLNAHSFLYFLQKNVTKRSRVEINEISDDWQRHNSVIQDIEGNVRLIEFGAGKSLRQNIFLYYANQGRIQQTVVDYYRMMDLSYCAESSKQIASILKLEGHDILSIDDLESKFSIEYLAPFDLAKKDGFLDEFDLCISTNTLEHIPRDDIVEILRKLKRAVKNRGRISAIIDYSDHYSHTDHRIGRLNFLQFSEAEWRKHNSSLHYQNRLRHQDYREIFRSLGFEIERDDVLIRSECGHDVDEKFDAEDPDTFALRGWFVLINNG